MKTLCSFVTLLCILGCSTDRPAANRKIAGRELSVPVPGGGTQLMTIRAIEPSFKAAAIVGTRIFVWRFDVPQGTTVSNFWWDLQRSTNLASWVTTQTNIMLPIDVFIDEQNPQEFYRLKGRL